MEILCRFHGGRGDVILLTSAQTDSHLSSHLDPCLSILLLLDARWLTGIFHSVGRVNLCVEHSKLRRTGGGAGSTLGKY